MPSEQKSCLPQAEPETQSDCGCSISCSSSINVLLVEDDCLDAEAIICSFRLKNVQVTLARTLTVARALLRSSSNGFDAVILDLHLPDGRGESLLPDIEACPRQPAAIISSAFLAELEIGALQYRPVTVAKPVGTTALLQIVKAVVGGYTRPMIKRFVARFGLSRREGEATLLVARGLKAKEIADRMCCSEKTVYFHLTRVCEKVGCRDYHEVVGKIVAFTCQSIGHTPPDHKAFSD